MAQRRIRSALALAVTLLGTPLAWAAGEAKVFPVKAFFYDAGGSSHLDPRFRARVAAETPAALADRVHKALNAALADKLGPLDSRSAGRTFTVSFHVTRANSFSVDKKNGNADLVASVTAGLYFTNVLTGEILTTLSRSVVSRAVVPNSSKLDEEQGKLFGQAVDTLIAELVGEAAKNFSPTVIDAKVTDRAGELLVLDAGYAKGIQAGDTLSDASGQLIEVVYVGEHYAVAERILADAAGPGAVFQKYLAHAADGKVKPRTVVLIESRPEGFAKDYLAQLFSELVGTRAPLSLVQVNTGFSSLLKAASEQSSLSLHDTARRRTPELFIRLRVAEPIWYEARTNLDFKTQRHYETLAFADVVDASGRVLFSAVGKDVIDDSITRNVGAGVAERRDVSVKNALTDLATKLGNLSELKRDQVEVVAAPAGTPLVAPGGKVFSPRQQGVLLRKQKVQLGKGSQSVWIPVTQATVEATEGDGKLRLGLGRPYDMTMDKVSPGNVFEVQRLGVAPRSAQTLSVCGPVENLGALQTPSLLDLTSNALGRLMPGMLYVPGIAAEARGVINQTSGFAGEVKWSFPPIGMCVQPVDRVNAGDDVCASQCERPVTARYTLRVKAGNDIVARPAFEGQFKSTSFYKQTEPAQVQRLVDADLIDEAQLLLDKVVEKISFPSN